MKKNKIKSLTKQLKGIKDSFIEEKKLYCIKNKIKIKNKSKDLYNFFIIQEKKMKSMYEDKIKKKKKKF